MLNGTYSNNPVAAGTEVLISTSQSDLLFLGDGTPGFTSVEVSIGGDGNDILDFASLVNIIPDVTIFGGENDDLVRSEDLDGFEFAQFNTSSTPYTLDLSTIPQAGAPEPSFTWLIGTTLVLAGVVYSRMQRTKPV